MRCTGLQTCAPRPLPWYNFGMKNSVTRDAFLAIVAVTAALVPFLNKAFHIDDSLFLWMAQQVSQHSTDPYGFSVNWYVSAKPMFSIMQNPPLNAYYIALAAKFLGWSFPCPRGCGRSRNVFSGATSVGFTFTWSASCAFHARLAGKLFHDQGRVVSTEAE